MQVFSTEETWCTLYKGGRISARISTVVGGSGTGVSTPAGAHNGSHMFVGVLNGSSLGSTDLNLTFFSSRLNVKVFICYKYLNYFTTSRT